MVARFFALCAVLAAVLSGCSDAYVHARGEPRTQALPPFEPSDVLDAQQNVRWFRTRLPARGPGAAVYLQKVRNKFEAYLGDAQGPTRHVIYKYGDIEDPAERAYLGEPPHLFGLPPGYAGKFLYIRSYSNTGRQGPDGEARIGTRADHITAVACSDLRGLIFGIVPLFLGGAVATVFLLSVRARIAVAFGAFCLCYGVYLMCHTQAIHLFFPYPLAWDHLQYAFTYLAPFWFIDFAEHVIGGFPRRLLARAKWVFVPLAAGTVLGSAFALIDLPRTLPLFQGLVVALGVLLAGEVAGKVRARSAQARVFGAGAALVALTAINDVLVQNHVVPWAMELSDFGVMVFILLLVTLLTKQLELQTRKSHDMARELETAGILQTRFLPLAPFERDLFSLNAVTRAASQVGGDWYAYRVIAGRWLQIHLGDVTGHGTGAALLAAFAKGAVDIFYQDATGADATEPALDRLHTLLNQVLCDMGRDEASMTLVSLSVDLHTGAIAYVNSGHLAPLLCAGAEVRMTHLNGRNDTYLGVDRAFASKPPFSAMARGDEVLVLHSDGVYELFHNAGAGSVNPTRRAQEFLKATFAGLGAARRLEPEALLRKLPPRHEDMVDDVTLLAVRLKLATGRASAA